MAPASTGCGVSPVGPGARRPLRVTVWARPGAARTDVGGRHGELEPPVLVVKVQARAVDGKANAAVVHALADALGVRRAEVRIVSGHASRTKVVEIDATSASYTGVADALQALLGR